MKINISTHENITVIQPEGQLDSESKREFELQIEACLAGGARWVVFDMSRVSFLSSAGLRVIHNTFNQLRKLHQDADDETLRKQISAGIYKAPYLKVCGLGEAPLQAFTLGGFDTYIQVYNDLDAALKSFGSPVSDGTRRK